MFFFGFEVKTLKAHSDQTFGPGGVVVCTAFLPMLDLPAHRRHLAVLLTFSITEVVFFYK